MKKTITLIFGTRPEAVKMCPLVRELLRRDSFSVRVMVTGQHGDLLREVLSFFGVQPDVDLSLMRPDQTPAAFSARALVALSAQLESDRPDMVLVHGDTATAYAGALAAFYQRIPVGHVEAGLRSGDVASPFPEEFYRRSISLVSHMDFAPTPLAGENLLREGKNPAHIYVTGNTVADALRETVSPVACPPAARLAKGRKILLLTLHRRENFAALPGILRAVRRLSEEHPEVAVLYPVHPNPTVQAAARALKDSGVICLFPLPMAEFHNLLARSELVLTDSGGVQEEAVVLGVPAFVLRERTERQEGVACGGLALIGTGEAEIVSAVSRALADTAVLSAMRAAKNPFGDGYAAKAIADILEREVV